jgi:hypothetical protein
MARPVPPIGEGLGKDNRKLNRMGHHSQYKDHDPKARNILLRLMNF